MSSGIASEKELKNYLESQGYFIVRSDKSEGAFDLVAIRDGPPELVQVKSTSKDKLYINKMERDAIKKISEQIRIKPILAVKIKDCWLKCDFVEVLREDVKSISMKTPKEICEKIKGECD